VIAVLLQAAGDMLQLVGALGLLGCLAWAMTEGLTD
jgi:hypothetical protein